MHKSAIIHFDELEQQGVFFASDKQAIAAFLATHYPGFDLLEVMQGLNKVADIWGFEWGRKSVGFGSLGGLMMHHQYDNVATGNEDDTLLLRRILKNPTTDKKRVSHEAMYLPPAMQQKGLSRHLILPYYEQYANAKIDFIDAQAGATGGGYALARYGFAAANKKEALSVLNDERLKNLGVDRDAVELLHEDLNEFYSINHFDSPFSMWEWSQTSFAKELLMGTHWKAVLNLQNRTQKEIFESYLYSSRRALPLS